MRGHIRRRGSRWSFVIETGRDPATGKRRQRWHSGFERRRDAERALSAALARLERGDYVEPSKLTLAHFVEDHWLPAVRATVRPGTFESYRRNLRNHVLPELGGHRLQALSPATLNALYGDLLERLAPATVRQVHAAIHRALGDAVRWNYLARNVAAAADPPPAAETAQRRTWEAVELRSFLEAIADERLRPLYVVLAQTGMRRGEALGARWQDVDLEAARLAVRRALVPTEAGVVETTPKTARGQRSVALDVATVRILRAWRKRQLEERLAWGPAWQDTGRLFTREDGTDVSPRQTSQLFDVLVKRSGLPRIRLHDLRHSHATLALRAGVHPKVMQERLGHASVRITLDTYSHAIPAMQEDAAATVAALVGLD